MGRNEYYKSDEEYFHALAAGNEQGVCAIVDAGTLVQIDGPFLPDIFFEVGLDDVQKKRRAQNVHIEAINTGLKGIPAERVRFHTCYRVNEGPRIYEATLADIIEYVLKIDAGSISASRPPIRVTSTSITYSNMSKSLTARSWFPA